MAKKKRIKYEAVIVTIPNASVFGNVVEPSTSYKPDQDYRFITGVWGKVMNLANQPYIDLQLRDTQGNLIIDPHDSEAWRGGENVAPADKFREILMPITGGIVKPGAIAPGPANPNADIVVQFVFRLEDELIEIAS